MRRSWLTGSITGMAVCAAIFAGSRSIWAQGGGVPPTGRVACLNVIQVLNDYQRQKDLIDEAGAYQQKLQAENKQRRDKLDQLDAQLSAMDPDDPTLTARMREMLAMQIDYKNWGELVQANMAREFSLWSGRVFRELLAATEEIAQREGYDMVFYRDVFEQMTFDPEAFQQQVRGHKLVYANSTVDVSQMVLDKLNSDYRAQPKQPMLQVP
jgi:Skp family chaperone for outer membrane proteins